MPRRMKINRQLVVSSDPRRSVKAKEYYDLKRDEEWRRLEGYENVSVSNLGRVKVNNKLKKQRVDTDGYLRVGIENNEKSWKKVHQLVARTFVPNPDNLPVIDHINGNKQDNRAKNLRWCTVAQNSKWAYEMGLIPASKSTMVLALNVKTRESKIYPSQAEAARQLGITSQDITAVIDDPKHTRYGYNFFRLKDLDLAELFGDEYGGTTAEGGIWAEHADKNMKVRIVDNRDNPMTQGAIKKLVCKVLDKIVGGEL